MFTSDLHSPYFPIACNVKLSWKGSPARGYISQAPLHPDGAIWWVLSSGMWLELVCVTGPPHTHIHIGPTANCQHLHFFSGRLCPPGLALPTDTSRLEMPGNYHPLANSFKQMIDNMDVNPSSSSFKWEDSETCNLHWVPEFPQQDRSTRQAEKKGKKAVTPSRSQSHNSKIGPASLPLPMPQHQNEGMEAPALTHTFVSLCSDSYLLELLKVLIYVFFYHFNCH